MGNDIAGNFIGVLLAFALTVIMPFTIVAVETDMMERRLVVNNVSEFIDGVVDSRVVSDSELESLNLELASYGMTLDYEIKRYAQSADPDPTREGSYTTTYMLQDDNRHYEQGDKISVHVESIGYSSTISLARRLTGVFIKDFDVTLTARVR